MKNLLCMRHAKSDWSKDLPDHDRPLNKRGRRDAPKMARALLELGFTPEKAIISSAQRTRETFQRMQPIFEEAGVNLETSYHSSLYHSGLGSVQSVIDQEWTDTNTILLIGHNPGWSSMVSRLCNRSIEMTTANIVVLSSAHSTWNEAIRSLDWTFVEHLFPREL